MPFGVIDSCSRSLACGVTELYSVSSLTCEVIDLSRSVL